MVLIVACDDHLPVVLHAENISLADLGVNGALGQVWPSLAHIGSGSGGSA